ncbi:UNVERIFIED_CONTAM: putative mitochondrial protein [Sesamum radiatum]|uniref:Mitochondrial protein n=1 Tax=Sesamum radiatum TaxID=300843 RepID=A0AAW2UDI7_SESRA
MESWNLLRKLRRLSIWPWLVSGDFNEILTQSEKEGGADRPLWQMRNFRQALLDCELTDLFLHGNQFTWCNRQESPATIRERIDRACADPSWNSIFPNAKCTSLASPYSDHDMLLVELEHRNHMFSPKNKQFRFEASWFKEPNCELKISDIWHSPSIRAGELNASNRLTEEATLEELESLLLSEEIYWKQRGKNHWLKEGDKNTKFFHTVANKRRHINHIRRIRGANGNWLEDPNDIQRWIENYFTDIFRSRNTSQEELNRGTAALSSKVSPEMAQDLIRPYTKEEVETALFQMAPFKSPGSDGMPPIFYHHFWHIVKFDVVNCVLDILNDCHLLPAINNTHIVLIPKCYNLENLTQFRPISLCNVVYKIASKIIANRLKRYLDQIISPTQSAFVPGRLITDNVLIAYELNHHLKTKTWGKTGHMMLKLDISKAYDKIEWSFLRVVLLKLGFPEQFVRLILLCVSSVSYSFIMSGSSFGTVTPQRGLRQGDPLSPYLFLLCTEAISSLLQGSEEKGHLKGVAICRRGLRISHLLFADDTLICCQGTETEATCIQQILDVYGRASGQEVNLQKSTVVFSKNVSTETRDSLANKLGIRWEDRHAKYLGLPAVVGKSRKEVFSNIRDKIWHKIQGWNERFLSQAGKEILIKAVVQAIPAYAMGCFKLPTTLVNDIQRMISDFWWHNRGSKKIHWVAWHKLCIRKEEGGMGFKDLKLSIVRC